MGYTIKQKIAICLKAESDPSMTQADLANWAKEEFKSAKAPSQTTISRILCDKNDYVASKDTDFEVVRRRKQLNPMLRRILTEWITQCLWENLPITTPIIQSTALAIWNRLPVSDKDGKGTFNQKWCNHFIRKLNINITGDNKDVSNNPGRYPLNKVWNLHEKYDLKLYLRELIRKENYRLNDIFIIDEFQLFYSLPLDQIFDVSSIDKGLKQSNCSTEDSLTIMIGTNIDGSEKLTPLIVGKYDRFDTKTSTQTSLRNLSFESTSSHTLTNKLTETYDIYYKSNINKWVTSSMFQNYLLTLDHKLSGQGGRKILILLDNSSSHRIINVKFNHIKLCYLRNNSDHENTTSFNNFSYLPSNFGIFEELKILYRTQQYLAMLNKEAGNSASFSKKDSLKVLKSLDYNYDDLLGTFSNSNLNILSENDYTVPMVLAIEWIRNSWACLSPEVVFNSWKKSFIFSFKMEWPASNSKIKDSETIRINKLSNMIDRYNMKMSYERLNLVMETLNTVIPWDIDELISLVNERGKVTSNYVSIEEMICSCFSEAFESNRKVDDSRATMDISNSYWLLRDTNLVSSYSDKSNIIESKIKSLISNYNSGNALFGGDDMDLKFPSQEPANIDNYFTATQMNDINSTLKIPGFDIDISNSSSGSNDKVKFSSNESYITPGLDISEGNLSVGNSLVEDESGNDIALNGLRNKRRQFLPTGMSKSSYGVNIDESSKNHLGNININTDSVLRVDSATLSKQRFSDTSIKYPANALKAEFVSSLSRVLEMSATNEMFNFSDNTTKELRETLFEIKKEASKVEYDT